MAEKKNLKKGQKPRVNKMARPVSKMTETQDSAGYRCTCCGRVYARQLGNFNTCRSVIYHGNNGFISICKKCMAQLYDQFLEFYNYDEDAAAERICQITDMYFNPVSWAASRGTERQNRLGAYISQLNLAQNKQMTYSDSLVKQWEEWEQENQEDPEEIAAQEALEQTRQELGETQTALEETQLALAATQQALGDTEQSLEQTRQTLDETRQELEEAKNPPADEDDKEQTAPEIMQRFGVGFTAGEYQAMQTEYDSWVRKYGEPIDKRQDELYISLCYLKLNLQQSLQSNASGIGTLANSYKSFIEAATIEIEDRRKKAEADRELKPLGVLYRDIEQYCPAEFYKNQKLYADFDSLGSYYRRFIWRPLKNLLTGAHEMDGEFSISDTEEE